MDLNLNEKKLILDAIELWLDSVTPYDFDGWAGDPIEEYKQSKRKMEELKEKIKGV